MQVPSRSLFGFLVDQPPLHLVVDRPRFLGGEAVGIGERLDHCPRRRRVDLQPVQRHHPGDGALPALGGGAAERDPGELLLVVRAVAGTACLLDGLIGDRDAGLGLGWRGGRGRSLRLRHGWPLAGGDGGGGERQPPGAPDDEEWTTGDRCHGIRASCSTETAGFQVRTSHPGNRGGQRSEQRRLCPTATGRLAVPSPRARSSRAFRQTAEMARPPPQRDLARLSFSRA